MSLDQQLQDLSLAAAELRRASTQMKVDLLKDLSLHLTKSSAELLACNSLDLKSLNDSTDARTKTPAFRDRLTLNPARIDDMVKSLAQVAKLKDPVGEVCRQQTLANGLQIEQVRAPLGAILMIFESRPNVAIEAFSLAFFSGNAIALRGGKESAQTTRFIYQLIRETFERSPFKRVPILGIENPSRELVDKLLKRSDIFDVVVPRGGHALIEAVSEKAQMPVIKNDRGLCHLYIHSDADLNMAEEILINGKTQRPGVCNSLETVLLDSAIAKTFLSQFFEKNRNLNLEWRMDESSLKLIGQKENVQPAQPSDWDTEHLDLILNCRVVDGLDEALKHIAKHGSKHSEAIVTRDKKTAEQFLQSVDAAATYWNASTRFTDGYQLGLGGELGISTQKLHVRGPVGLNELTSLRWIVRGSGQVR